MLTVFKNCKYIFNTHQPLTAIRGSQLANLPFLQNHDIFVEKGVIIDIKPSNDVVVDGIKIDCSNNYVLPTWVDSHTHTVFAASREVEFVMKLKGKTYAEIAASGGGILNSAAKIATATEEELYDLAFERINKLIHLGTGAIEIKTGYGLSYEAEIKMLNVINRLKNSLPIPVKVTLLVAHAVPTFYKSKEAEFIKEVCLPLIEYCGVNKLADFIDVFCETGFFSVIQLEQLMSFAAQFGLKPKVHVNQLTSIGGLQAAIQHQAISVDHLETMTEQDIADLAASNTIGTLLPTAAYFLRMTMPPARKLIEQNAILALASDYNPGSSPSGNMNWVVSMACIAMKMLPEEAINAATINAAFALQIQNEVGSISVGKKANFIITKPIPSIAYYPYAFGENLIETVIINGEKYC
jgi:imidazolonepropionase